MFQLNHFLLFSFLTILQDGQISQERTNQQYQSIDAKQENHKWNIIFSSSTANRLPREEMPQSSLLLSHSVPRPSDASTANDNCHCTSTSSV